MCFHILLLSATNSFILSKKITSLAEGDSIKCSNFGDIYLLKSIHGLLQLLSFDWHTAMLSEHKYYGSQKS